MKFRRLHPEPGELEGVEAVADLAGRDVLAVNMVVSADGRAAFEGKTAPLSDPADRELFHLLRSQADAILVGTGTLREERYGALTKNDRLRALRADAGLEPDAIGVTLTRTLDLPYDIPLFQDPASRLVVYTTAEREPEPCPAELEVVRLPGARPGPGRQGPARQPRRALRALRGRPAHELAAVRRRRRRRPVPHDLPRPGRRRRPADDHPRRAGAHAAAAPAPGPRARGHAAGALRGRSCGVVRPGMASVSALEGLAPSP